MSSKKKKKKRTTNAPTLASHGTTGRYFPELKIGGFICDIPDDILLGGIIIRTS